jgi:hypothetical protein
MYSIKKLAFGLLVFILFSFLAVGCTTKPYGDRDTSKHVAGAAIGGAAAGFGTAALGAPRPMIVGAAVGGMALGYYVTTLRFDAGPIYKVGGHVYSQGDYVGIDIPSYKLFDANTAELRPDADPLLDSAVAVLKRYPDSNVLVSGNTSGMGAHRYDQKLSQARARRVAAYLWSHGIGSFKAQSINTRKLSFVGYGDYFPIASDVKIENVQKNSRIQITVYPSKKDLQLDKTSQAFENVGSSYDPGEEL